MRCLCWYAVFWLSGGAVHDEQTSPLWPRLSFGLVIWAERLCKPKPCCHVLFREDRLSPCNPSKQAVLVQSFSKWTLTVTFNLLAEACWVWDVALGDFFQLLPAFNHLTLGWIRWDVHSWEDQQLSWMFSTFESTSNCLEIQTDGQQQLLFWDHCWC